MIEIAAILIWVVFLSLPLFVTGTLVQVLGQKRTFAAFTHITITYLLALTILMVFLLIESFLNKYHVVCVEKYAFAQDQCNPQILQISEFIKQWYLEIWLVVVPTGIALIVKKYLLNSFSIKQ